MRKIRNYILAVGFTLGNPFHATLFAQSDVQKLTATILQKDSLFWITYNTCDTIGFQKYFTQDVEFYHDKGGITLGLKTLTATIKNNLCGTNNYRLRREVVQGTLKVFPLQSADKIYGAILSGNHVFYVLEQGKEPRLDGQAKFTHLWLLKDDQWKMARVLSYDHGPAVKSK